MKYRYGQRVFDTKNAAGVKGVLISSADGYCFRVYSECGDFIDYTLLHDDLEVTIDATALASFYINEDSALLDHSPSVLGLTAAELKV